MEPSSSGIPDRETSNQHVFSTTHWSVVLRAGDRQDDRSHEALTTLCQTYRPPLLAFALASGMQRADAEDATQDFLFHFLKANLAGRVTRRAGTKFRSFLIRCFKNFMADRRDQASAQKRGGALEFVSLDETDEDGNVRWDPRDQSTPESEYERAWAAALLNTVLDKLEMDYIERNRQEIFVHLHPYLLAPGDELRQVDIAERLGMSHAAVRKEISRMRQRYRELFQQEVGNTIGHPQAIEDEMEHLLSALRGGA